MHAPTGMIVHICARKTWHAALGAGVYAADTLATEGFIHLSKPDQVLSVANRYYPGQDDLVILWVEKERLTSDLRWESSDGDVFPHVFGPLNLDAILAVTDLTADPNGRFTKLPYPNISA